MAIPSIKEAVDRLCEVVMFENWLRFYFIAEEDDALLIRLPETAIARLREKYPSLVGLAERLNNKEINHTTSLNEVCLFVASSIDGTALPEDLIAQAFGGASFQSEVQLFNLWVQGHEEQLDAGFMEFATWKTMFTAWKSTDEVRQYLKKLSETAVHVVNEGTQTSQ